MRNGRLHIAMISVHQCPLAPLGRKESGGMNVYVRQVSRELAARGHLVDIYTRRKSPEVEQVIPLAEGARVIHLMAGPYLQRDKNEVFRHLPEFVHNLRRFQEEGGLRYDLIHSHYWLSGWVGRLLQRRWRAPHVTMFHTLAAIKNGVIRGHSEPLLRLETEAKVMAAVDHIMVASKHEKAQMMRLYMAEPQKIEVIPGGVDPELFRPIERKLARAELGLDEEKVVLFVGRMQPLKGADILLKAVAALEYPADVRVLVVGGELRKDDGLRKLRQLARELGLASRVTFVGAVEHERLPTYYNAADVLVVPSYYESFGLVAVEALACGTPVIASRVGGLSTIVRDGETGFLIPWRCPGPFTERLELLLGNDNLRAHFARAARPSVSALSWSAVVDQTLDLYLGLLEDTSLQRCRLASP